MDRKSFITKCGKGCLGLMFSSFLLESCSGTRYVSGNIDKEYLVIDAKSFLRKESDSSNGKKFYRYLIVENHALKFPIVVFKNDTENYTALLMQCTHQGAELQVYGDRLQCPAHGSEFNSKGIVTNGPAMSPLKSFLVEVQNQSLKIKLS